MDNQRVYFPNLNGLRFIAAFLVIIHHIEQFKLMMNIENYWEVPFIMNIGKHGVVLFFVLSGFLITYLLLAEEHISKKITISKFYIRRILRIWPLYYLIIILAFFILPNINIFILPNYDKEVVYSNLIHKLILYIFFLPNLVLSLYGIIPYVSQTWSIGTEEQFYLIWPIIIKYFRKNRILLMFSIIIFYLCFKLFLKTSYSNFIPYKKTVIDFWHFFSIDCMAIGGFYAVILFQKNKLVNFFQNIYLFYATLIITIILMLKGIYIPYIQYEFFAVLFGLIIFNLAANNNIKISLENKILIYLGNISYGLYMYHPIGIVFAIYLCKTANLLTNWVLYPLSITFTILLSELSYRYFETYFLKFKDKFSVIKSGSPSN